MFNQILKDRKDTCVMILKIILACFPLKASGSEYKQSPSYSVAIHLWKRLARMWDTPDWSKNISAKFTNDKRGLYA